MEMVQVIVRCVANIIEVFFITYYLRIIQNEKYKIKHFIFCVILYLPCYRFLGDGEVRAYIIRNIYLFLVLIFYLLMCDAGIKEYIPITCILLSMSNVLKTVVAVISVLVVSLISQSRFAIQFVGSLIAVLLISFIGCLWGYILKLEIIKWELSIFKKYMACFGYTIIICAKIPFLYTDISDGRTWKMIFLTIICCTVVFLIISKIDKHNAEEEKAKIEENNKILLTKLHKSKEILPAVVYALNDMAESGKIEMEEQNTHKLLAEVADLYGLQVKEDSKDDLRLKNFCSTGLTLLDQQLRLYQSEALDRNVNLDILVQAPIDVQMKKNNIDRLRLQRAVGDMVRNAFRAIEREDKKCRSRGHVLLIIGCRYEDILEIAVVDNGAAFPLCAVESFGRRGITTGGTGNGLADLVEFAKDANASIWLEEFPETEDGFTKKLAIVFDNQRKNFFKSSIREQVESSFWNFVEL